MNKEFQVRSADIAAYIVFQFNALEATLNAYQLDHLAEHVRMLKCAFISQAMVNEIKKFKK